MRTKLHPGEYKIFSPVSSAPGPLNPQRADLCRTPVRILAPSAGARRALRPNKTFLCLILKQHQAGHPSLQGETFHGGRGGRGGGWENNMCLFLKWIPPAVGEE